MSALRELLALFSIHVEDKELKDAEKGLTGFVEKLKHAGETFAEVFAVEMLREFVEGQIEAGAQLKITSEKLGTTTDELQAMQLAANEAGVSSESLATGLRFLNRNLSEAATKGGEHAALFKKLGISIKETDGTARPAGDVMGDLADSIASIKDPARQVEVAMKLLGRGGVELLPLLKEGGEAFEEARKQMVALGGGMSKEFVEQAHEAERANVQLKFAMTGLKSEIASALLPAFEEIVRVATKVTGNLRQMAKEPGVLRGAFLALAAGAAVAAPVVTAVAVAGGILYLAIDELYNLLKGNDTVIGDALGDDKTQFVTELSEAIDELTDAFGAMFGAGQEGTETMSAFSTVIVGVAKTLAEIVELLTAVSEGLAKIGRPLGDLITGAGAGQAWADLKDIGSKGTEHGDKYAADQVETERKMTEHMTSAQYKAMLAAQRAARGQQQADYDSGTFVGPTRAGPLPGLPSYLQRPNSVEIGGDSDTAGRHRRAGKEGDTINQTNHVKIDIAGADLSNPEGVKAAVGEGVATGTARANNRAHIAKKKP